MFKKPLIGLTLLMSGANLTAQSWGRGNGPGWGGYGEHWWWSGRGIMGLVGLLLAIGLLIFVVKIAKKSAAGLPDNSGRAEQIVKERYARGEIDQETMKTMLEELRRYT